MDAINQCLECGSQLGEPHLEEVCYHADCGLAEQVEHGCGLGELVLFTAESVHIRHPSGCELIAWDMQEWVDDPAVVFSIAQAIKIVYQQGPDALRTLLKPEDQ